MISVVIPTISAREKWLALCLAAYEETTETEWEPIVIRDQPTCGIAWNFGIERANGHYIQLSADDLEPLPGWWQAAIASIERGELPAPRILNPDGTLQSCGSDDEEHPDGEECDVARIPFATAEQFSRIGPMMREQYMGDYWFSHRGRKLGLPTKVVREYAFIHHYAPEGRLHTLSRDVRAYRRRGGR